MHPAAAAAAAVEISLLKFLVVNRPSFCQSCHSEFDSSQSERSSSSRYLLFIDYDYNYDCNYDYDYYA